ncbi:uncharacterized protein LOC135483092 isoform X2 [Lineus longissimus]|uniref:uncharacterized protein LOC135483092 isoform X2 n=1 Tax=Lineus longissimus TaxID=88925 RepID=UPI002B4F75AF
MKSVRPPLQSKLSKGSIQISEDWLSMAGCVGTVDEVSMPEKEGEAYVEGAIKLCNLMKCPREIMCLKFGIRDNTLAVGLCDGSIKIIDPLSCELLYNLSNDETKCERLPVTAIQFLPAHDGQSVENQHILMATYASGCVRFWNYRSSVCSTVLREPDPRQIFASALNPEGTKFITAGSDDKIYIYDIATRKHLRTCEPSDSRNIMNGHRFRVYALQYHPDRPREFISGGWDDTIMFWDDRKKHAVRKVIGAGPHICGNDALDIDPVHNHILTGSWRKDKSLQIWDYDSGEKIKDVPYDTLHTSQLYCAKWLGKSYIMCGGSEENMARIIDRGTLNTVGQLVDLDQGVVCMDSNLSVSGSPRVCVGAGSYIYNLQLVKTL